MTRIVLRFTAWTVWGQMGDAQKMAAQKLQVGSDIVYHCTKCDLDLGHTIVAMVGAEPVRVRCNTCRTERNYRAKKTVEAILRPSSVRPKIVRPDLYQQKLQDNLMKTPKNYRIDATFEMNDVVIHSKFGKGVVIRLQPPDRVEILFQDESRVLMCKFSEEKSS